MTRRIHIRIGPAVAAATLTAACGDGAGPSDALTVDHANQVVQDLLGDMRQAPAVRSLSVLGPKLELPAAAAAAAGQATIPRLERGLGRTLRYDPVGAAYVWDDADAPPDVVRFLLYEANSNGTALLTPIDEIGVLDVSDRSAPELNRIGVDVVLGGRRAIVYQSTASGSFFVGTLAHDAFGFLDDGERVDFTAAQRVSQSEGVVFTYVFDRAGDQVEIVLELDALTLIATSTITVEADGETIVVTTSGTTQQIEGKVEINGDKSYEITGTPAGPVFSGTGGPPSPSELLALHGLFEAPDLIVAIMDAVLTPAYWALDLSLFITGN